MGARSGGRLGLIAVLVYRSATRRASPAALLDEVGTLCDAVAQTRDAGDAWTELLITCGEMASAMTDAVCGEQDEITPLGDALVEVTVAAARGALAGWSGDDRGESQLDVARALSAVRDELTRIAVPTELQIGVPEGFAYYGLYPETYAAAARTLLDEHDAPRIVCIGIRSIGVTLAAVVAAVVQAVGREAALYTVRPRGHPFDRTLALGPALHDALAREAGDGALFAIVDEGPGLSGSSFASAAEAISGIGVPDDRIVLLPSWVPAADDLRSARGQERWRRHQRLCIPFEQLFDEDEEPLRIAREFGIAAEHAESVGSGAWRHVVYDDERDWPAVQPQHERRKYLLRDARDTPVALLRFAGLGRYGRVVADRARTLGDAGLAPRVLGAHGGFVATEWLAGEPAHEGEAEPPLVGAIARHVAHLATTSRTGKPVPFDELLHITSVNTTESLGEAFADRLVSALERFRPRMARVHTCAVDGHMLPHEWIRAARGWIKVDGVDHHDDHFLPGDQDPAWDIAGAEIELLLDRDQRCTLVEEYARLSGDHDVAARLPFHRAVYLATRLGYVTLSAEALGDEPDATRLRVLARRYAAMLRRTAVTLGAIEPVALPAQWRDVRAIIFDADGTLRRTTVAGAPCPHAPDEWRLLPWAADGALTMLQWGDALALGAASNQDHVGYGHLSERQARALLRSMLVEATGAVPDRAAVQLCPHVLEEPCACRKPGDGMLRALLAHFDLDPDALLFVGDAATDAEAARRAGVRFAHVDDIAASLARSERAAPATRITASAA